MKKYIVSDSFGKIVRSDFKSYEEASNYKSIYGNRQWTIHVL